MVLDQGDLAIALVRKRVMVVKASRSHDTQDLLLDVCTYLPFGERLFLETEAPNARISPRDLMAIFPKTDILRAPADGMLELPDKAFSEFLWLSAMNCRKHELLWNAWVVAH